MGARTDKILGRAKQALGAITGDNKMKHRRQLQEDKGELKLRASSTQALTGHRTFWTT